MNTYIANYNKDIHLTLNILATDLIMAQKIVKEYYPNTDITAWTYNNPKPIIPKKNTDFDGYSGKCST